MQPTLPRMATHSHGIMTWRNKPTPVAYKSPYFRGYKVPFNIAGYDVKRMGKLGAMAAIWGIVAGVGTLMFTSDVPKVRKDIMQKLPFIGDLFVKEIPASDNPF